MNKSKFLEGLKEALQGEVSVAEINNQLLYYERYIDGEMKKGRTEKEIVEQLGAPRLIARTIIETKGSNSSYHGAYYEEQDIRDNQTERNKNKIKFQVNGTMAVVIGIILIIVVISLIFSLVTFLAPIIIPVLLIAVAISYLSKKS